MEEWELFQLYKEKKMILQLKDLQSKEVLITLPLVRFMINDDLLSCMVNGGLIETAPEKNKLYEVNILDTETGVDIVKVVTFYTYNFLMDKSGGNQATITDNSLVFHIFI